MSTCIKGTVSWECLYPTHCSCSACCCQGSNCQTQCTSGTRCTQGGCCNGGRDYNYDFAMHSGNSLGIACGDSAEFADNNCSIYTVGSKRVDTIPPGTTTVASLSRSFFMNFAPLSQGIITNMLVTTNAGCC